MRILQIIFCLFSISMAVKINGFAPIGVGSQWTYSYFQHGHTQCTMSTDSEIIVIEIKQHIGIGTDTLLQLQVNQNGIKASRITCPFLDPNITTVAKTYFDTVIIRNDSLFKSAGYQCPIFPFWKSNSINTDSFYLDSIGGQKLYSYKPPGGMFLPQIYSYGKDTGLYKEYSGWSFGPQGDDTLIQLLSFKPQLIGVQKRHERLNNASKFTYYETVPVLGLKNLFGKQSYDLYGKRIAHTNKYAAGLYVIKKQR